MKKNLRLLIIVIFFLSAVGPVYSSIAKPEADPVIVISTGVQTTDTVSDMIEDFNANVADGFTVELQTSTWETQNQHDTYATKLAAKSGDIDIISMDVIWPPEFTAAGWLDPLDFMEDIKDEFLEAPILAGTYEGKIYGMPWFHDSAMLYYRTDVLEYAFDNGIIPANRAPQTWAELHDWSIAMLNSTEPKAAALLDYFDANHEQDLVGFVWQGREYEGLVCDFMEFLGGTGKYTFLNEDGDAGDFNSTEVRETLAYMKSLIDDGASPQAVLTYQEETSRAVWNAGNAIFHRNWPYAYRLSLNDAFLNGSESSYLGTNDKPFGVVPMPAQDLTVAEPRTSCLGGWQLGLNTYSEHKAEAKIFMKWLTEADQQKTYLFGNGQLPTRKSVYSDPAVLADNGTKYIAELYDVFLAALPRPVHKDYPELSASIWAPLHSALSGGMTIDKAVGKMDEEVNTILESTKPTGINDLAILTLFSAVAMVIVRKKRK